MTEFQLLNTERKKIYREIVMQTSDIFATQGTRSSRRHKRCGDVPCHHRGEHLVACFAGHEDEMFSAGKENCLMSKKKEKKKRKGLHQIVWRQSEGESLILEIKKKVRDDQSKRNKWFS